MECISLLRNKRSDQARCKYWEIDRRYYEVVEMSYLIMKCIVRFTLTIIYVMFHFYIVITIIDVNLSLFSAFISGFSSVWKYTSIIYTKMHLRINFCHKLGMVQLRIDYVWIRVSLEVHFRIQWVILVFH